MMVLSILMQKKERYNRLHAGVSAVIAGALRAGAAYRDITPPA
jgi:hypothetical protein